jgi:Domain of unknown function (DUF4440)
MRLSVVFAVLCLSVSAVAQSNRAPEPIEIATLEQHLWTTMAQGDFATVRKLFTPDFIQIDDHIQALDSLLITLKHCKLESYELQDLQVRILTPDSALTAYHVLNSFECGTPDKPLSKSFDNNSMTAWVREPGTQKWLVQAHTETPAKP